MFATIVIGSPWSGGFPTAEEPSADRIWAVGKPPLLRLPFDSAQGLELVETAVSDRGGLLSIHFVAVCDDLGNLEIGHQQSEIWDFNPCTVTQSGDPIGARWFGNSEILDARCQISRFPKSFGCGFRVAKTPGYRRGGHDAPSNHVPST